MNFKFSRLVHTYYLTLLVALGVIGCVGIAFYWYSGPANIDNVQSVFEASLEIEALENHQGVKEVKRLVDNDKTRDAFNKIRKIEQGSKLIDSVAHKGDAYRAFRKSLRKNQDSLTALISFPELSSVIDVLNKKVASFEKFVVSNRWRTLTRMSKRLRAQLSYQGTPGFFNYSKMEQLHKEVSNDIRRMRSVTLSSVLSRHSKEIIVARLASLQTELSMIAKYLKELKKFNKTYKESKSRYDAWFKEVQPGLALKRMEFERNSKIFMLGLVVFIFLIGLGVGVGLMVYKASQKKSACMLEKVLIRTIHKGLIPIHSELHLNGSHDFMSEFERAKQYIHKRMAFGNIFREATPFATILLDSNLNIVWANDIFYENWDMADYKQKKQSISWDYLQRFTNLGGDDPVLTALNNNVAGIYQIQVKTGHDTEAIPYEMYVSPVDYADQKRIMIFFYPLRSVEESIANQTQAIVGPVKATINAMIAGEFSDELKAKLENEFKIAGIESIYNKFINYEEKISGQQTGLMNEIDSLESEVADGHQILANTWEVVQKQKELQQKIIQNIGGTKTGIVDIVDLRGEMEQLYLNTVVTAKNILKDEREVVQMFSSANGMVNENVKVFNSIKKTTSDFKELKNSVEDFKSKIIESLNQALIFQKSTNTENKGEQHLLSRMRMEMKGFERDLNHFGKIVQELDISIKKIDLMMERNEIIDIEPIVQRFNQAKELLETDMFNVSRLTRSGQGKDEEIVQSLKKLVGSFRDNMQQVTVLENMLKEELTPEIIAGSSSEIETTESL